MDPIKAREAELGRWYLNPKGTRVRVLRENPDTSRFVVETEKGIVTEVSSSYPLCQPLDEPAAPSDDARLAVARLVGRGRDHVEPFIAGLSNAALEELLAQDSRPWVQRVGCAEKDRRTNTPTLLARVVASVAPGIAAVLQADADHAPLDPDVPVAPEPAPDPPSEDLCPFSGLPERLFSREEGEDEAGATEAPAATSIEGDARSPAFLAGRDAYARGGDTGDCPFDRTAQPDQVTEWLLGYADAMEAEPPLSPLSHDFAYSEAAGESPASSDGTEAVDRARQALEAAALEGEARPSAYMAGRTGEPCAFEARTVEARLWAAGRQDFQALVDAGILRQIEPTAIETSPPPVAATETTPAPAPRKVRGFCAVCGKEGDRIKSGAIRQHVPTGDVATGPSGHCPGSGTPALTAAELEARRTIKPDGDPMTAAGTDDRSLPFAEQVVRASLGRVRALIEDNDADAELHQALVADRAATAGRAPWFDDSHEPRILAGPIPEARAEDDDSLIRNATDQDVWSWLDEALAMVATVDGSSAHEMRVKVDNALEARESLRSHLRPVLDVLDGESFDGIFRASMSTHLRSAIQHLRSNAATPGTAGIAGTAPAGGGDAEGMRPIQPAPLGSTEADLFAHVSCNSCNQPELAELPADLAEKVREIQEHLLTLHRCAPYLFLGAESVVALDRLGVRIDLRLTLTPPSLGIIR